MELSLSGLRVLREIADRGTFTAAAAALRFSQPAVSRQVAALERAAGVTLFERRSEGARLTAAGRALLRHATVALDAIDAAERELAGRDRRADPIRLGVFSGAHAVLTPRVVTALRADRPDLTLTTREGSSPVLIRALRAGALDLAVVTSRPPHRPPDSGSPALVLQPLLDMELRVAVAAASPLARSDTIDLAELALQPWIVAAPHSDEPLLGAWAGLPGRPDIRHVAGDWMARLRLVEADLGVTTIPSILAGEVGPGIRVLTVAGGAPERRHLVAARLPGPAGEGAREVLRALGEVAATL
jgi:DNA-binding transcriptional LysR family regulator